MGQESNLQPAVLAVAALRSVAFRLVPDSIDPVLFHIWCSVQFRFGRGLCCHFCCHKRAVTGAPTCDHAADFKFERMWLPLIADNREGRNLRSIVAVFARLHSLETVLAAVKVAVKISEALLCRMGLR